MALAFRAAGAGRLLARRRPGRRHLARASRLRRGTVLRQRHRGILRRGLRRRGLPRLLDRLPVLALRALAGITPHPGVLSLLRRTGVAPADYRREYFGEELAFRLPAVPSAEWKALADADRRARRWETRTIARRGGDGTDGPCLLLHWDEPPTAPFLAEDSPLPAAAFRPLPADASPEARALRATSRWLLVPVARSTHSWILRHGPAFATNAPAALFPDDVKVTVHRHAEVAEEESHAESAESESHAESAEQ